MRFNETQDRWEPDCIKVMQKYNFVWNVHPEKIHAAEHGKDLSLTKTAQLRSAAILVGSIQMKFENE